MTDADLPFRPRLSARTIRALLGLVLVAAAALRFYALGRTGLWIDEATSVALARMPWRRFFQVLWSYEANMTVYYFLLRGWMELGTSEAFVRSLSAVFGVAGVGALYLLGRRLLHTKAALLAAALLAVHVLHVWGSREARTYSLVVLLAIVSTHLFVNATAKAHDARLWAAYVAVSTLAVYAHLFAVLVIGAQWLAVGSRRWREVGGRRILLVGSTLLLTLAPMGLFVLLHDQGQVAWIRNLFNAPFVAFSFVLLNGMNPFMIGALGVGLVRSVKQWGGDDEEAWATRLLASWFVFPIALVLAVSFLKPVFFFRYFAICVPAAALLAASELTRPFPTTRLRRGLRIAAVVGAVGVSSVMSIGYVLQDNSYLGDWRGGTAYILAHSRKTDAAIFDVTAGLDAFHYYQDRGTLGVAPATVPVTVFPSPDELPSAHIEANPQRLRAAVAAFDRVWVVKNLRTPDAPPLDEKSLGSFHLTDHKTFGVGDALDVSLFERNAGSSSEESGRP